jgi:hypothetical protein
MYRLFWEFDGRGRDMESRKLDLEASLSLSVFDRMEIEQKEAACFYAPY